MSKQKRPEIGTVMWDVHENLYYDRTVDVAPLTEYVVTSAPITGYYEGGFVEICMVGPVPYGDRSFPYPRRHRLSDLGNRIVFTTAREAALYAKNKDDREAFLEQLRRDLMYYYWSKCEWEIILSHWPPMKDAREEKIDVYDQVRLNWDRFCDYVWVHRDEFKRTRSRKK